MKGKETVELTAQEIETIKDEAGFRMISDTKPERIKRIAETSYAG